MYKYIFFYIYLSPIHPLSFSIIHKTPYMCILFININIFFLFIFFYTLNMRIVCNCVYYCTYIYILFIRVCIIVSPYIFFLYLLVFFISQRIVSFSFFLVRNLFTSNNYQCSSRFTHIY